MIGDWAEIVDLSALGGWMDAQGLPEGEITDLAPLGGGTQNIMLRFARGGREFVMRRPPKHPRAVSNEVLRREARLLGALRETDVTTPRLIAACMDESVLGGSVFYLMDPVDGFNPGAELPDAYAGDDSMRHAMALSAVEGIARLGNVDYEALGLADFGKPDGFLERQVSRWLRELEGYGTNDGYSGPDIPHLDRVARWLEGNRPRSWRPGIMHGDCHLANMMFRWDVPELAAMVDWEMSTIGDPLLDLGWQIATSPAGAAGAAVTPALAAAGGVPTAAEMIEHYARFSDRDLSAISWYTVLAGFKLGIILEGTYARAAAGKAPREIGDKLHGITVQLFAEAAALIG
nr:phosphotransferase family protein [Nocardia yamanashiensis]